ncbi:putative glycerophosphodiester phosphodiesterase [Helianthus annuus]|nr:putative glycerophosphodiester phosphodiesterase [Helianthus annuus]
MDTVFKFISPNSSQIPLKMALKTAHVTRLPNLDHVSDDINHTNNVVAFNTHHQKHHRQDVGDAVVFRKPADEFMVIGHRGTGMNLLQSSDHRMKMIKENSILAFNTAGEFNLDYIEFDVQVTKDDCPIIFHDNFIYTEDKGVIIEKRVTDMNLDEFLSYGPQREPNKVGKPLFRKTKDGRIFEWKVEKDDYLCTLEEVFTKINHSKGFNIEFKFDDNILYTEEELVHVIQIVLRIVFKYAKNRSIIFSSFQPDAALLTRKLQSIYPVFFLTNGGVETYTDVRRNSLDEAMKLCLAGGLNGMVCEVRSILRNPGVIKRVKDLKLSLISYGQLNNTREVVNAQILMGVDGVIVDLVQEITEVVANFGKEVENEIIIDEENDEGIKCSEKQLSSLMKVIEMKYICS